MASSQSTQKDEIKSKLHKFLQDLEILQNLQNELDESKLTQQNILNDIEKYSNYKRTREVEWVEHVPSDFYSRICSSCARICYEDWVSTSSISGFLVSTTAHSVINFVGNLFQTIIGAPGCDKCKCSRFLHYDDSTKPVRKTKTIENILYDVKAVYDQSKSKNAEVNNKISELSEDIAALNKALDAKEAAIRRCCEDLKKVSSQEDLSGELKSVIDIMQKMANKIKPTTARKIADDRIRRIKQVIQG